MVRDYRNATRDGQRLQTCYWGCSETEHVIRVVENWESFLGEEDTLPETAKYHNYDYFSPFTKPFFYSCSPFNSLKNTCVTFSLSNIHYIAKD